jgi:hypothetical protein
MNGVSGVAELLAETPLDPMQRQYVSTIVDSSRALLIIIDDVLDLAKLQADKFDLTVEPFSINERVARALDLLRPTAMKKATLLQANLQSADHPHLGDSGRLRQILLNLLGNTVKFTASGSGPYRYKSDRMAHSTRSVSRSQTAALALQPTAYASDEEAALCLAAGMDAVLTKPLVRAELYALLERTAAARDRFDLPPLDTVDRAAKGGPTWSTSPHASGTTSGRSTRSPAR